MSDWLNRLSPASFRGVPFFLIEDPTAAVGRRRANHEYAGRDEPYSEDLGRKQRVYSFVGGVDGSDFIDKANRLQDAFEQSGAGVLVHPYLGELNVIAEATFTYQGRFASFQVTAEEAGTNVDPVGVVNTNSIVSSRVVSSRQSSTDAFANAYDVSGPEFVRELTLQDMQQVLQSFGDDALSTFGDLSSVIEQPQLLAESIFNGVSVVDQSRQRLSVINNLSAGNAQFAKTPARQRIENNNQAVQQLVRQAVVIEESNALLDIDFETRADAQVKVNEVVAGLDTVSEQADDTVYRELVDLRVAVLQDMQARLPSLAQLETVNLVHMTPSLVAAYRYTGDAANEQQIVDRNRIAHPGFMRGSVEVIHA